MARPKQNDGCSKIASCILIEREPTDRGARVRLGSYELKRIGVSRVDLHDPYHLAVSPTWPQFLAALLEKEPASSCSPRGSEGPLPSPASLFVRGALAFVAALGVATTAPAQTSTLAARAPDTIEARVRACTPCHGARGQGTDSDYFPRLAGKPAGYLNNQLIAFRDGRRRYAPMNYLLEYQTEAYLQEIAAYFAAVRPPPVVPPVSDASAAVLAHGKALVEDGDQAHGVPACSGCHGPKLTGMEPGIPGLVGLHKNYISAQLGGFRYGTRTAPAPDCMQLVASSLSEADVTAVAAYLAAQPVPADPSPVPKGTLTMPFTCGSEPR